MIGVVLTGNLDDGTSGLADIKRAGGIVVAQDPKEALFPSMPRSAIEHLQIDHVVAITDLARLLDTLTAIHLPRHGPAVDGHSKTNEMPAVLADRSSPSKNAARRAALAII